MLTELVGFVQGHSDFVRTAISYVSLGLVPVLLWLITGSRGRRGLIRWIGERASAEQAQSTEPKTLIEKMMGLCAARGSPDAAILEKSIREWREALHVSIAVERRKTARERAATAAIVALVATVALGGAVQVSFMLVGPRDKDWPLDSAAKVTVWVSCWLVALATFLWSAVPIAFLILSHGAPNDKPADPGSLGYTSSNPPPPTSTNSCPAAPMESSSPQ
jgi:hypothetical protein